MIRTALAAAVVAAFAASPAHAASDCLANYQDFWDKQSQYGAKLSTETLVGVNQNAIRAFQACQSGDEANFGQNFWEQMSEYGAAKDPKAFWEQLSEYGAAK